MPAGRLLLGIVAIVLGSAAALWRSPLAQYMIERQNAFWGFRFGRRTAVVGSYVLLIWGMVSAAYGIALIVGLL